MASRQLDLLRMYYSELTAFERANMISKQAVAFSSRQNKDIIEALLPETCQDAYKVNALRVCMFTVAGIAVGRSLQAFALSMKIFSMSAAYDETNTGQSALEVSEKLFNDSEEWIFALRMLEKETGAALLDTAKIIAASHVEDMLEQAKSRTTDGAGRVLKFVILNNMWKQVEEISKNW